ncbi:hypothetical protein GGI06_004660 [Coemansia sp. S85]|nr:hypothetical protein GGI06_004660 [Coemansia sp. S85]
MSLGFFFGVNLLASAARKPVLFRFSLLSESRWGWPLSAEGSSPEENSLGSSVATLTRGFGTSVSELMVVECGMAWICTLRGAITEGASPCSYWLLNEPPRDGPPACVLAVS